MPQSKPNVVILGAGFGGLEATKTLRRAPVEITLIDRQNYHCFQPLLYQVATAALSPADIAWPIRHILRRQENATVFMADDKLITARVAGRSVPPFRYRHEGSLATIGRRAAVVELGHIQLTGFIGWMFWSAVHIYFLIGIRNRFVVAVTWLWSYVTFERGARLITEVPRVAAD